MTILKYLDIASEYYSATSKYDQEAMAVMVYAAHHNPHIIGADEHWHEVQQEVKQAIFN